MFDQSTLTSVEEYLNTSEARDGVLRTINPDIEMALGEIFSEEIR
jgi:hypothetical protein